MIAHRDPRASFRADTNSHQDRDGAGNPNLAYADDRHFDAMRINVAGSKLGRYQRVLRRGHDRGILLQSDPTWSNPEGREDSPATEYSRENGLFRILITELLQNSTIVYVSKCVVQLYGAGL